MPYTFQVFPGGGSLLTPRYWWRLVAGNNRIVADSGEGYDSESNAVRAIERVKQEVTAAPIVRTAV